MSSKYKKRKEKRNAEQVLRTSKDEEKVTTTTVEKTITEQVPVEETKVTTRSKKTVTVTEKITTTITNYLETLKTIFDGYLEKYLVELNEARTDEERNEICKRIADDLMELLKEKFPECKFVTHAVCGQKGENGYNEADNLFWEVGKDTHHRISAEDNKWFIIAWLYLLPLKDPEDK